MKKILIVADRDLGNSGVPAVIMSIVRGLHHKYTFDIIVFEETNSVFSREFASYGGKIIHLNVVKPESLLKRVRFYLSDYRKQIFAELDSKINIDDYFVIHSFKGIFSAPFFEYSKKFGVEKRIQHINFVYNKNPKFYLELLNKRNRRKCIKYSNIKLAVSNEAGISFYKDSNFKCVYNPINDRLYEKLTPYYERLSLTQIGTFSDRKNQLFSLEVFKIIKQKCPTSILNFLGYEVEQGYIDRIKSLAKSFGIEDSIRFFNQTYDQILLMRETTVCLFPSKSEAFGLVAVENQACNRPVICSKRIMREIDCGGAIFLDFDADIWAENILSIFNEKRLFNIDTSKFDSDNYCTLIESIYKK